MSKLCVSLMGILFSLVAAGQEPKFYSIAKFAFENGATLQNMRIAYDTYGDLNATPPLGSARFWLILQQ